MRYYLTEVYKTYSDDPAILEKKAHLHYALNCLGKSKKILCEQYIDDKELGCTNQLFLIDDEYMEE